MNGRKMKPMAGNAGKARGTTRAFCTLLHRPRADREMQWSYGQG
jgi:hypothetical protein